MTMKDNNSDNSRDLQHILLTIKNNYASFPQALKRVADYINSNADTAPYQSISEIASKAGVSEASITKFVKALGFKGFGDFKICLARNNDMPAGDQQVYGEISLDDDIDAICDKVFGKNIDSLTNTLKILDKEALEQVASAIIKAKRIDLYGQGSSALPAINAVLRLQRIGIRALFFQDPHLQVTSAALLEEGDIAIAITNSGRTHETVDALKLARESGATTVCITSNDGSPIIKVSDIKLIASTINAEIIEDIIASRIAELSILDALYICVAGKLKRRALKNLYSTADALGAKKYSK